jgi:hypothetical protein
VTMGWNTTNKDPVCQIWRQSDAAIKSCGRFFIKMTACEHYFLSPNGHPAGLLLISPPILYRFPRLRARFYPLVRANDLGLCSTPQCHSSYPGPIKNILTSSRAAQSGHLHSNPLAFALDLELGSCIRDRSFEILPHWFGI